MTVKFKERDVTLNPKLDSHVYTVKLRERDVEAWKKGKSNV